MQVTNPTTHDEDVRRAPAPIAVAPSPAPSRRRRVPPKPVLVLADVCTLATAMLLSFGFRSSIGALSVEGARGIHLVVGIASLPVWIGLFVRRRLYNARFLTRRIDEIRRVSSATALALLAIMAVSYTFQLPISRAWLAMTYVVSVFLMAVEREIVRRVFRALRQRGRLLRGVVIVGSNDEAYEVAQMLTDDPTIGYRVVGFVDDHDRSGGGPVLGPVAETLAVVRRTGAASVIVAASATTVETSNRLVRELLRAGIHVELSSTLRDIAAHRLTIRPLGRVPVVYVEPCNSDGWRAVAKRAFDIVVAGLALLVIAPIAAVIALAIKLDSRGPVIFRQRRVGREGSTFQVRKFRTMVADAEQRLVELRDRNEADGPLFKLKADPRVTRVGRILRKTSLDELPQLVNVLRGEMSIVGPRPALPDEVLAWEPQLHDRLRVRPGITGMWQVSGRSDSSFSDYTRLDLYYVDNWSLVTDLLIVLKTIPVVLFGRGAY
jgi:exopolysaccharide biosynthesis polyprenyl glycosylphosphotransferase